MAAFTIADSMTSLPPHAFVGRIRLQNNLPLLRATATPYISVFVSVYWNHGTFWLLMERQGLFYSK